MIERHGLVVEDGVGEVGAHAADVGEEFGPGAIGGDQENVEVLIPVVGDVDPHVEVEDPAGRRDGQARRIVYRGRESLLFSVLVNVAVTMSLSMLVTDTLTGSSPS